MPRVKRGVAAHKKHKKILQLAEGHRGTRNRLFRPAHESVMRSLAYMYRDRRNRKRDMRRLWITRINAAARMHGVSYSKLMHAIHTANIEVDRKILAEMVVHAHDVRVCVEQPADVAGLRLGERARALVDLVVARAGAGADAAGPQQVEVTVDVDAVTAAPGVQAAVLAPPH